MRLHTEGHRDQRVVVDRGTASLAWTHDDADGPTVEIHAPARHVLIWRRRPDDRNRIRSHLDQPDLTRLLTLLSGQ